MISIDAMTMSISFGLTATVWDRRFLCLNRALKVTPRNLLVFERGNWKLLLLFLISLSKVIPYHFKYFHLVVSCLIIVLCSEKPAICSVRDSWTIREETDSGAKLATSLPANPITENCRRQKSLPCHRLTWGQPVLHSDETQISLRGFVILGVLVLHVGP